MSTVRSPLMICKAHASLIEALTANQMIWLAAMWQQLNFIEALKTILNSKSDQIRLASGPDPSKKSPISIEYRFWFPFQHRVRWQLLEKSHMRTSSTSASQWEWCRTFAHWNHQFCIDVGIESQCVICWINLVAISIFQAQQNMTDLMNSKTMSGMCTKLHNKSERMDMIVMKFIQNVEIQYWTYFLIYLNKINWNKLKTPKICIETKFKFYIQHLNSIHTKFNTLMNFTTVLLQIKCDDISVNEENTN